MSRANKYRPQTFDEMVEQTHIVPILKAHVRAEKEQRETTHAQATYKTVNYLFYGPKGTGKTTSARLLAKGLNCQNPQDGNPCNQCPHCIAINNGTTIDIVEIDAASHTGVDNIREEILDKALYRPSMLYKKVYIIDEVHMLSKGAFNALLKIMEEPEEYLCFILATTEIHKVPETIVSRCQVFNFKKIPTHSIIEHLKKIAQKEGIHTTDEGLAMLAKIADGCARDAIKYLEQVSILGDITPENVSKFLGIAGEATIKEFITHLRNRKTSKDAGQEKYLAEVFSFLDSLEVAGIDVLQFTKDVLVYCNEHFLQDSVFYAYVAEVCKNVLMDSKRYPNPVLAYKTQLTKMEKEML